MGAPGAPGVAVACCHSRMLWVLWHHQGGWRRLRGCLFRSLLSLNRYAALRGAWVCRGDVLGLMMWAAYRSAA